MQHVVDCYTSYFNEHRPHQGIANRIPAEYNKSNRQQSGDVLFTTRNIARKDFFGGLLKSYRKAA
ncbi:MAG: hypothetical protein A2Y13_07190 [Planctomycetes bacterium GWC2_45_44]|nr:MAG: hypothetical protein A2Y13_07190 [Planctomycetes bacterium GWC2_45_44]